MTEAITNMLHRVQKYSKRD